MGYKQLFETNELHIEEQPQHIQPLNFFLECKYKEANPTKYDKITDSRHQNFCPIVQCNHDKMRSSRK